MRGGVNPYTHRRSEGHGEVVAQSVIPYSGVAVNRWQRVDGHSGVGYRHGAERQPVEGADYGEKQQGAGSHIPQEADEKEEKTYHQHLPPVETVDDKAAKRAYD